MRQFCGSDEECSYNDEGVCVWCERKKPRRLTKIQMREEAERELTAEEICEKKFPGCRCGLGGPKICTSQGPTPM